MRQALGVLGLLGLLAVLMAASPSPTSKIDVPLLDRLNGTPVYLAHLVPGADGGTWAAADAGLGATVKVFCYASACACAAATCTCGNIAGTSVGLSTTGELLQANGVSYLQLATTNGMVSVAKASGSTIFDGGTGADCDTWTMN